MRYPTLLGAAESLFGTSGTTTEVQIGQALRAAGLLPRSRRGMAPPTLLSDRDVATFLLARLVTDSPVRAARSVAAWGELSCLSGDLSGPGGLSGVPAEWPATATLGIGHDVLDLLEALVADALAGQMGFGRHLLSYLEITSHGPLPMITIGPTDDGAEAIRDGDPLGLRLQEMAVSGIYRVPFQHTNDFGSDLAAARAAHRGETPSMITTRRAIPLEAIAALLDLAKEGGP